MIAATLEVLLCLFLAQYVGAQALMPPKLLTPSSTRNVLAPPFTFWGIPRATKRATCTSMSGALAGPRF